MEMDELANEMERPKRRRVLSGMRPTGKLHLGNYMGALYNWVKLQEEYECFFFIADYHALTTDYADTSRILENTLDVALDFLSAGLDPTKCTIFVQSHVPQHAELHLLLSMITPLAWLERVPSYKDQQEQLKQKELNTYGFLGYPLLQSADILLYEPHYVPVGQDQEAHVELTREVARRFRSMYGNPNGPEILSEPTVLLTPSPKLPGTDGRKMSKSYGNTIMLTDLPFTVNSKMESMSNGGQRLYRDDPGEPNLCPVADLHKVFSPTDTVAAIEDGCRTASLSCLECKHLASKSITKHLDPIQERRAEYQDNQDLVIEILKRGADRASERASQTMRSVRKAMRFSQDLSRTQTESSLSRFFEDIGQVVEHNLEKFKETLLSLQERPRFLRNYWLQKVVPRSLVLRQDSERVFITKSNKRIYVTTSYDSGNFMPNQKAMKL
jgi:tryptophanyl-tRNA synthetase